MLFQRSIRTRKAEFKMKRLWIILLALHTAVFFCVGGVTAGAKEANTEVWSIYALKEDSKGYPYYSTPPSFAYTERGLKVTPAAETSSYTVQTDHAYYLDKGIYMEIALDDPGAVGVLVFHIWDQNGVLVNNFRCGSGWQCLIQLDDVESKYAMSALLEGASGIIDDGDVEVLGSMKITASINEDGCAVYSLELKDDVLRVNGNVVVGMEEMLEYMRAVRPDGSVYFGVSVLTGENSAPISMTVTRFGASKNTAFVPGTSGELPETGEDSPGTVTPGPAESTPPESDDTAEDPRETASGDDPETDPDGTPVPGETTPDGTPDSGAEEEQTTDDFKSPFEETEPETKRTIQNDKVDSFMGKLEQIELPQCGASLGGSALGILSLLATAYICARKRE
jgi:hypothetical protein